MKKSGLILVSLLLSFSIFAQRHFGGKFETDIFDNLIYERNDGYKASLKENIFEDKIFEDSHKNKLVYKKKFLDKLIHKRDKDIFVDLIRYFDNKTSLNEEFDIDIFDKLKYSNNQKFNASFSKNIFGDVIYEDSNENKIIFKQKFLDLFELSDLTALDAYLFMDILYSMMDTNNYKEEYEVDIFDNVKYTSSEGISIKIEKEKAIKIYNKKKKRRSPMWKEFF